MKNSFKYLFVPFEVADHEVIGQEIAALHKQLQMYEN